MLLLLLAGFMYSLSGINWMKHLNNLGVKYYIVGATDRKTAEFLSGQVCACGRGGRVLLLNALEEVNVTPSGIKELQTVSTQRLTTPSFP